MARNAGLDETPVSGVSAIMLTLTYTPDAYKQADNLQPAGQGGLYESRPGFFQVVTENINRAIGWNDACIMEIFGGVYVWHGGIFEAIKDSKGQPLKASLKLTGSRFQALQSLGNREERMYVGDGKTLLYLHRKVIAGANVTGVAIEPEAPEVLVNTTTTLSAIIEPAWAINKKVTWTCSDHGVATVDADGVSTGVMPGSAMITATTDDGSHSASVTLTVTPYISVTGITLEQTELTLEKAEEFRLGWQVQPEDATDTDVYWWVDDLAVCSVKEWGTVTGLQEGETRVRIRTREGHFEATCKITVVLEKEEGEAAVRSLRAVAPRSVARSSRAFRSVARTAPAEQFYEAVVFDNEFLDAEDAPYPLPEAKFLATWRSRLWAGDGTHIIYHCLNDDPHHWEPLDAIQIQGGDQSEVTGLCPFGNKLMVSTARSIWQIVGDSPYNWEFQTVIHGHGAVNDRAMATDGLRLFYLDWQGIYELGKPEPISEPIKEAFYTPDYDAQLLLDAKGEYLYALIRDRLFVYNTWSGGWGEIHHPERGQYAIKGLVLVGGQVALYGDSGLWVMGSRYTPDVWHSAGLEWSERKPVPSTLRTWPVQPNAYGLTSLNRMYLSVEGYYQGTTTYGVYPDELQPALAEQSFKGWRHTPREILIRMEPLQVVHSEVSQRVYLEAPLEVSGPQFEHQVESLGYVRYHKFAPVYFYTERSK